MRMKEYEYIEIDPQVDIQRDLRTRDFFTEGALAVLGLTEFGFIVKAEPDRILTTDIDFIGVWTPYEGKPLRAEQVAHLLKAPLWTLPDAFYNIWDVESLRKYDLHNVDGALYYNGTYPIGEVVDELRSLSLVDGVSYEPFDGAYLIFPN